MKAREEKQCILVILATNRAAALPASPHPPLVGRQVELGCWRSVLTSSYPRKMRNASVDSLTGLIADLVRIDSGNLALDPEHAGETRIARFVAEWAEARGLAVEWLEGTPGRPSVVVTAKGSGSGANLLLNGHLDTVGVKGMDDPFDPKVQGDRMYGRGVFDMKASLAACLLAVAEAKTLGLAGDVPPRA